MYCSVRSVLIYVVLCYSDLYVVTIMNVGVMCVHCPLCLPATDALVRGGNIEELISSGLELLSSLISHGSSIEELKCFMEQMLEQLVHSAHASILFLIRVSCSVGGRWE